MTLHFHLLVKMGSTREAVYRMTLNHVMTKRGVVDARCLVLVGLVTRQLRLLQLIRNP